MFYHWLAWQTYAKHKNLFSASAPRDYLYQLNKIRSDGPEFYCKWMVKLIEDSTTDEERETW